VASNCASLPKARPNRSATTAEQVSNFMSEPRNRRVLAQMARAGVTTLRVPSRSAR
jgi:uncharacterized protein YjiS (DUF1127 family)